MRDFSSGSNLKNDNNNKNSDKIENEVISNADFSGFDKFAKFV